MNRTPAKLLAWRVGPLMHIPDFLASGVEANPDGRLPELVRGRILTHLRQYHGVPLDILIRKHRVQRSLDQNAYLHAEVFPKIADYTGDTIEDVKYVLMGHCFGWKRSEVAGREVPVKPSTSSMTVQECTHFIDWVLPWAVEHCNGLQIVLPDEWQRTHAA